MDRAQATDDARWERVAAGMGIAAVILFLVGSFIPGAFPQPGDPVEEIQSFYQEKRTALLVGYIVLGLGAVAFVWFLGAFRAALGRAEGPSARLTSVTFAGGILQLVNGIVGGAVSLAVVFGGAAAADPSLSHLAFNMANISTASYGFTIALFIGASSLLAIRTGVLPRWLALLGFVTVAVGLIGTLTIFSDEGFFSPGGAYGYVGFALFSIWLIAVSITLMQALRQGGAAPARAAAA